WYLYTHPDDPTGEDEGTFESIGNDVRFAMAKASYSFKNAIKQWLSEVLEILYEAASLCINTIRTFFLIVMAILGPLAFGIAVFDGFQHTLTVWIARYINIFLWLPVANIFGSIIGKIQENMLKIDISQINTYGDTFFSSMDVAYLVFLIIGIVGYFTVPSVANYIVQASGGNPMLHKVTSMSYSSGSTVLQAGAAGMGSAGNLLWGNTAGEQQYQQNTGGPADNGNQHLQNRLSGNDTA
ncbi:MAG: conjugative transposon protein TraJ, partial [Hymenobacter sp.]